LERRIISRPGNAAATQRREVAGIIDGEGQYSARVAAGGPLVFFGTTAVDAGGELTGDALVEPPYHLSPAAHAVHQGHAIFRELAAGLEAVGSGLEHILQVEQFTPAKAYADGYITTRGGYLAQARPTTALAATGPLLPEDAVVCTTGTAVRPGAGIEKEITELPKGEEGGGIDWSQLGQDYAGSPPYNDVVVAGPYVFVTGDVTLDPATGEVDPAARVPDFIWAGSEARNEADVLLARLGERMEQVGGSLDDVVHVTLMVTDITDIFEIDRAWKRAFGDAPPARTLIPVRGLGVPRREGTGMGHRDDAVKMEQQVRGLIPGRGADREVITTDTGRLAHEAEAVRAGDLVWMSHQYARTAAGTGAEHEVDEIFASIDELATAASGGLSGIVALRAFVTDLAAGRAVHAKVRECFDGDPPVVSVTTVPGPLLIPGAELFVDAVAHVG
jgi:2-iminobutanoate/2-iminopropanoate deaminase